MNEDERLEWKKLLEHAFGADIDQPYKGKTLKQRRSDCIKLSKERKRDELFQKLKKEHEKTYRENEPDEKVQRFDCDIIAMLSYYNYKNINQDDIIKFLQLRQKRLKELGR